MDNHIQRISIAALREGSSRSQVILNMDLAKTGGKTFANPTWSLTGNRLLAAMSQGGASNTGTLVTVPIPAAYR